MLPNAHFSLSPMPRAKLTSGPKAAQARLSELEKPHYDRLADAAKKAGRKDSRQLYVSEDLARGRGASVLIELLPEGDRALAHDILQGCDPLAGQEAKDRAVRAVLALGGRASEQLANRLAELLTATPRGRT